MGLTHQLRLVKAAYGLNDAPRLWRLRLDQFLRSIGGVPSAHGECLYIFRNKNSKTEALLSTHVDDIKGCANKPWVARFVASLEKMFGKCATKFGTFDHCGI